MPTKKPTTVAAYLKSLPEDRREAVEAIRACVLKALPKGYEERIQYGMIGYAVPYTLYPPGYHCDPSEPLPFMGIGNQKGHIGLYMFCLYTDEETVERFADAWKATGKRLDMGKACVRVKRLEDVPMDVLAKTIRSITVKKFVASYEGQLESMGRQHPGKKTPKKTTAPKKVTKKKATKKKVTKKKTTKKR